MQDSSPALCCSCSAREVPNSKSADPSFCMSLMPVYRMQNNTVHPARSMATAKIACELAFYQRVLSPGAFYAAHDTKQDGLSTTAQASACRELGSAGRAWRRASQGWRSQLKAGNQDSSTRRNSSSR